MAPTMLHVFSDLSALASNTDIKEAILTNYSDIPSTTEAATRLQNIQFSINEPLVTFNHRYEAIHKVAFRMLPSEQESKTVIDEYAKKLPANTRDKLLRKIAKKNLYIKTLDNAFDCNEGEVLEICTMEQLEKELPRNWIPERKRQEKFSEFFENPFMQKDDDFLKSPAEAPVHRKVLLEDKNILPKTQEAFDKLCEKYDDIISKNSSDIGKIILVEMENDTGNHPQ